MVVFFDRREKKQYFQGKQMFFSDFFCARHNVFQPEGYIFLGFHPLTYHKPLHFDRFCFILPLQILLITWPLGRPPAEQCHNVTAFKIMKKKSLLAVLAVDLLSKQFTSRSKKSVGNQTIG
jgi:hypothetical protein